MFSPNRKRPELPKSPPRNPKSSQPMTRETKRRLWTTVALTFILLAIWYGSMGIADARQDQALIYGVMIVYFLAFATVLVIYLAYNRAFVNKDVTVDMLPDEWSDEKKQDFVDQTRIRAEKSRWMVTLIIPFAIVFMVEFLYLFLWDGYLSKLVESWGFGSPFGGSGS